MVDKQTDRQTGLISTGFLGASISVAAVVVAAAAVAVVAAATTYAVKFRNMSNLRL